MGKGNIKRREPDRGPNIQPPSGGGGSTEHERIRFSFVDFCRDCLDDSQHDDLRQLVEKLKELSSITWAQSRCAPRHGLGSEEIPKSDLRFPIPAQLKGPFRSFRFCGLKPMIGYRDGSTFHVLWLDVNFAAYDHG